MKKNQNYYIMTNEAKTRFKVWQIKNRVSVTDFAKKCDCSRTYIYMVLNGKKHITKKTRELFEKGGYKLL